MKNNRIAYYLPNKGYTSIDFSDYKNSNPGIGGSEYAVMLVADELARRSTTLEVYLFVDKKCDNLNSLNNNLHIIEVVDQNSTLEKLQDFSINYFVYCYGYFDNYDFWSGLGNNTKVVVLCECFLPYRKLNEYSANPQIARIITVGREQLDLYRDHKAFKKSDYIYNPITVEQIKNAERNEHSNRIPKTVTFMGSLTPAKSFNVLAKAWPMVLEKEPNATLNVIGGGNLYNREWKLGKWGLAEEKFENEFIQYLLDENGNILPSVKFWGVLGSEKNEVLKSTCVGVPNPTGTTETYGFVAVEMQLAGCLVTTMECPGFLDTVVSPQAVLYNDPSKLAHSIISLLNQQNISHQKTLDEIFSKFNLVDIGEEWEKLFIDCIPNGSYLHDRNSLINPHYAFKWLREFNRRLNGALPKWLQLPPVLFVELALFKLKIRRPYYLKF